MKGGIWSGFTHIKDFCKISMENKYSNYLKYSHMHKKIKFNGVTLNSETVHKLDTSY